LVFSRAVLADKSAYFPHQTTRQFGGGNRTKSVVGPQRRFAAPPQSFRSRR